MNELNMSAAEMDAKFGPETVPVVETAPVEAAPTQEITPVVASDPDLDRATAALERDGWSKADIARLEVDRVKALGSKRHENQGKIDSDYRDLNSRRDAEKLALEKAKNAVSDSGTAPLVDISGQLKTFETEFGPEAAKALEAVLGPMAKTVEGLRQQSETIKQAEVARERTRLQEAARAVYAQAADPMVAKALFTLAGDLQASDATLSDDAAVMKASEILRGPVLEPPKKAEGLGNVAQAQPRAQPVRARTERDRELAVMDAIDAGVPRDQLRKIFAE